jgi:glycosyltransferase involved in cell wall biosynthesis
VPIDSVAPASVFYAYRDAPERRAALREPVGAPARYRLFGLDEISRRGAGVQHNLERTAQPRVWARAVGRAVNEPLSRLGGYGGDFASIVDSLRQVNAADVVLSTVDTVGIPLMLLKRAGVVRAPLVYVAIGLPERLARLRGRRTRRLYASGLRNLEGIVTYSESEAEQIADWIGADAPPIRFIPFGVDVHSFQPATELEASVDIVSVGADPRRDFALLLEIARRRPDLTFHIVTSAEHARALHGRPANVELEQDVSLVTVRDRLAQARVVALPVKDNSYSGATTVLLQAMAMAKPVVVSRTAAISRGYGLEGGVNCRLVEPGDVNAFERALLEQVTGADAATSLGTRARDTVARNFSWERYTDALWQVLCSVSPRP